MKLLSGFLFLCAGLAAWFMWGPLLHWLLRLSGESGLAKVVSVVVVGYFGGIAIPLVIAILAIIAFIKSLE